MLRSLVLLSSWVVADTTVRYFHDIVSGAVSLQLVPTARLGELAGVPVGEPDPLVRVMRASCRDFRAVAPACAAFRFVCQRLEVLGGLSSVITDLADERAGHWIEHRLSWRERDEAVTIETTFLNDGAAPVSLKSFAGFALGGLSPFASVPASGRLRVHRVDDGRSAESPRAVETFELRGSERLGPVGGRLVRSWLPLVAIEDTVAGVVWAAELAMSDFWCLNVACRSGAIRLSGGLFPGRGRRAGTLLPGEAIDAPTACLTCVAGDLEAACARLASSSLRTGLLPSG